MTNLSKAYGNQSILTNIDLITKENEISCIYSDRGTASGKTTFAKLLTGIVK